MTREINIDAVIGLAIGTAMLRLSYDNNTTFGLAGGITSRRPLFEPRINTHTRDVAPGRV